MANGYLLLASEEEQLTVRSALCDLAQENLREAISLAEASEPMSRGSSRERLHANQAFLAIMASHTAAGFHSALDLAFRTEVAANTAIEDTAGDEPSYKARIIIGLKKYAFPGMSVLDRARIRNRLWRQWAGDWIDGLDGARPDPGAEPSMSDWLAFLLELEHDEMHAVAQSARSSEGAIPQEVRRYALLLIIQAGFSWGLLSICAASAFNVARLDRISILPDEYAQLFRAAPERFWRSLALQRGIAAAVTDALRGDPSCTDALRSIFHAIRPDAGSCEAQARR